MADVPLYEETQFRNVLVAAGLYSDDPASIPGVNKRISVDKGIDDSFQPIPYNTRHSHGEKVRCSVCAHRAPHYTGFVVRNGAGEIGLVGIECGESRLFGPGGWQRMRNQVHRAQSAALYDVQWKPAVASSIKARGWLRRWADLAEIVDEVQQDFLDTFDEVAPRLRRAMKDDTLSVYERIDEKRTGKNGEYFEKAQIVPNRILTTQAAWFFRGRTFSRRVLNAEKKLREGECLLTPDASLEDIKLWRENAKSARQVVAECEAMLGSLSELHRKELWVAIARWVRSEKLEPANLRYHKDQLIGEGLSFSYTFDIPQFDLSPMREALKEVLESWPRV